MAIPTGNVNWLEFITKETAKACDKLNRSEAIVPTYALQAVGPLIEMLRAEGAVSWAPSSVENVKNVTAVVKERFAIGSTKGLSRNSDEFTAATSAAARFRDAVEFYAACCVMLERTGLTWDAAKCRVPIHWLKPMLREYDEATSEMVIPRAMRPIQKAEHHVHLTTADGLQSTVSLFVTMKNILQAAKPVPVKVEPTAEQQTGKPTPDADPMPNANAGTGSTASGQSRSTGGATGSDRPTLTLATLLSAAASMMAKASWVVTGYNADALTDFLKAFAEGHPFNRALLLEIATTAPVPNAKTADTGTTIDGECREFTPPAEITLDVAANDVIDIPDHVGNAA